MEPQVIEPTVLNSPEFDPAQSIDTPATSTPRLLTRSTVHTPEEIARGLVTMLGFSPYPRPLNRCVQMLTRVINEYFSGDIEHLVAKRLEELDLLDTIQQFVESHPIGSPVSVPGQVPNLPAVRAPASNVPARQGKAPPQIYHPVTHPVSQDRHLTSAELPPVQLTRRSLTVEPQPTWPNFFEGTHAITNRGTSILHSSAPVGVATPHRRNIAAVEDRGLGHVIPPLRDPPPRILLRGQPWPAQDDVVPLIQRTNHPVALPALRSPLDPDYQGMAPMGRMAPEPPCPNPPPL